MANEMTGYSLSRRWFNFCFENPEKISPNHSAIYFFAIEHCNRLGWKEKFGFPTQMAMEAVGIKGWRTYQNALKDLVDWGFIDLIKKSKNQYSSCVISLCNFDTSTNEAPTKPLDKALMKHDQKHSSITEGINKQYNNRTTKPSNKEQGEKSDLSIDEVFADEDSVIHSPRMSIVKEGESGPIVNGVLLPEPLRDVDQIAEAYSYYVEYMKENFSKHPTSTTTQMDLQKLMELQEEGNDPVEVIKQTIQARNKSFYALRDYDNTKKRKTFTEFLNEQEIV